MSKEKVRRFRKGDIYWVSNKDLGFKDLDPNKGHNVLVKEVNKDKIIVYPIVSVEKFSKTEKFNLPFRRNKYSEETYLSEKELRNVREEKTILLSPNDFKSSVWSGFKVNEPIFVNKNSLKKSFSNMTNKEKYWFWFYKKRK